MAEEFQGGVCGSGNYWWNNTSTNLFRSSPCSMAINGYDWPNHDNNLNIMDIKTTSSTDDSTGSVSDVIWNNQDLNIHDNKRSEQNYSNNILQQSTGLNSSMNYRNICEEISPNFPLNSASYSLLQNLFDINSQPEQSLLDNNQAMNYSINSNEFLPNTLPNFTNTTPFWNNATAAPLSDVRSSYLPSPQSQLVSSSRNNKKNNHNEAKKTSQEPAFKRARIETPSSLPTFKVRKEKMGDRITALQQLVSPFGKTDTASVLHEAIEYIKFLHDQVSVLTTPYSKNGSPPLQHQQANKLKNQEDLKSRGLCLVPISSTFPVASETTSDFWTPTFGASFR